MKDEQPQGKAVTMDSSAMSLAEELYRSKEDWSDEGFISALESKINQERIDIPELADKLTEYYAWCAQHGPIVDTVNYLTLLKRILDHKQSIPGHHDIRIVEIDEP